MIEYIDAKSLLIKVKKPFDWFGYDFNVNIYKGCSHGCIYCDSRSSCYQIDNFDKVKVKRDAIKILQDEMSKKRTKGIIGTGAMSDPYNPLEKKLELTKNLLQLAYIYNFDVCLCTKSDLVLRDLELLKRINQVRKVIIIMTITTFDDELCKIIEPNVTPTSKRFEAIKILKENNIEVGISLMPVLPFINDSVENITNIVQVAGKLGVRFIYPYFGVTIRDGQREYLFKKLEKHFPDVALKYKKYFSKKYSCNSYQSKVLYKNFVIECNKYGIKYKMNEIIPLYKKTIQYHNLQFDF